MFVEGQMNVMLWIGSQFDNVFAIDNFFCWIWIRISIIESRKIRKDVWKQTEWGSYVEFLTEIQFNEINLIKIEPEMCWFIILC